jgi:NADH:ubiquinone oxidoreductase subunit E
MLNSVDSLTAEGPLANAETKKIIDECLENSKDLPGGLMVVLNELQNKVGYISEPIQQYVALKMGIPMSTVHGVVSFYSFFTTTPRGKHTIKFCMGTACYVGGIELLIEKANQILGVKPGQTTPDGNITLEICRCVGACSQAPVVVVDDEIYGRAKPNKLPQILHSVQEKEEKAA